MWTRFWDMHSGGGLKEAPYSQIYIEAPKEEAEVIFYNRFGHNPNRVSCTCCGEDYSIDEGESLSQLTGFHRDLTFAGPPAERGNFEQMKNRNKVARYFEPGEAIPKGWTTERGFSTPKPISLDDYLNSKHVLVIEAEEISPSERRGELPEQGYIWVD